MEIKIAFTRRVHFDGAETNMKWNEGEWQIDQAPSLAGNETKKRKKDEIESFYVRVFSWETSTSYLHEH